MGSLWQQNPFVATGAGRAFVIVISNRFHPDGMLAKAAKSRAPAGSLLHSWQFLPHKGRNKPTKDTTLVARNVEIKYEGLRCEQLL